MPIKIKEPPIFYVEFEDMAGNHWKIGLEPIPDDILSDLQSNPEKVITDTRVLDFIKEIQGPVEGTIEGEEDKKALVDTLHKYGGVIFLLNTGILKAYMNALERLARAEKNSKQPSS